MDYTQKRECGLCLENATLFQIQDMFENGKPDIVLKTVNRFNINRINSYYNFDFKKSLKLRIIVLVMSKKMLVIVFF